MKQPTCEELSKMSMFEILEIAIANEIESLNYYKAAVNCVGDKKIKELLRALACIEKSHKIQLEGHLDELKAHYELSSAISRRCDKH